MREKWALADERYDSSLLLPFLLVEAKDVKCLIQSSNLQGFDGSTSFTSPSLDDTRNPM